MTLHNIFSLVFDVFVAVVVYTAVTHRFNSHAMEKCVYSQIRHGMDIGRSSEKKPIECCCSIHLVFYMQTYLMCVF